MKRTVGQTIKVMAANAAILFGALLVAACLAEVVVRIVAPQQLIIMRSDIWMPDDSVGWRVRGNVRTHINTGERDALIVSDSAGFRAPASRPHLRGEKNVLLLGDSFMQALQVGYDSTTGALLERDLTKTLGRLVSVWNAGVDGWDPDQYLIRARQLLARRSYDAAVVTIYVDNDIIARRRERVPARKNAERHAFHVPRGFSKSDFIDAVLYPLNDYLDVRSHLYVLMKHSFDTILLKMGLSATDFPLVVQRVAAGRPMWDLTAKICADLSAAGAQHHVPVIFAIIPAPYQVDSTTFNYYVRGFSLDPRAMDIDQPQRIFDQELTKYGLRFVDVLPAFRARAHLGKPLYGHVDRHLTPLGHEMLASQIMGVLPAAIEGADAGRVATPSKP